MERAAEAGYKKLVLTVDVPVLGHRPRDTRNALNMPFRINAAHLLDFALHPRWTMATLRGGIPSPKNYETGNAQTTYKRHGSRAGADWNFLDRLRKSWKGEIVVKGVLANEDARRIVEAGADAIQVSNHGGRQLESAPPAVRMLPKIRETVGPDFPIFFDSGIRGGEDVVKALALGADFVFLGRPLLYAIASAGADGLRSLVDSIATEIDVVLAQLCIDDINDVGTNALVPFNSIRETGAR